MPRLFYPPLVEPGVLIKPKGTKNLRTPYSGVRRNPCFLLGTEDPVAGIAQSGNNVGVLIEPLVHCRQI